MNTSTPCPRPARAVLTALLLLSALGRSQAAVPSPVQSAVELSGVPFIPNDGQLDARVAFHAGTAAGRVFVTRDGRIVHSLRTAPARSRTTGEDSGWVITETLLGQPIAPRPAQLAATRVSSFIGNDPTCWRESLPTYNAVDLGRPWSGVGVSLRLRDGRVEKLFRVEGGASEEIIGVRLEGAQSLRIAADGDLVAQTGLGEVRLSAPIAYQEDGDSRIPVAASYRLSGNRYGFRLGPHDATRAVVIDPVLQAMYLGGSSTDEILDMTVDPTTGDIYVVGDTSSTDFPFITDAAQSIPHNSDAFAAKLSGDLTAISQATYLGGSGGDVGRAIALNPTTGEVVLAGSTPSTDFPGAGNGSQSFNAGGWDSFVSRLGADLLSLGNSTYFGGTGNEQFYVSLAVHPTTGRVFLTGETDSTSLLFLTGGAQTTIAGGYDAYLVAFEASLAATYQATYYGGTGTDFPFAIAIDAANDGVLIAGTTTSTDLPDTFGSGQPSYTGGNNDAFVALLRTDLAQIRRSIYLGGTGQELAFALALDPGSGDLFVAGRTDSTNFQGRLGGAQPARDANSEDAFVARLESSLVLLKQATYLGGSGNETAYALAVAPVSGDVLVAGYTESADFPGRDGGAQTRLRGRNDAMVARFNSGLTRLLESTYFGGHGQDTALALAFHPISGDLLVAGWTTSPDLSLGANATYSGLQGLQDGFLARLSETLTGPPTQGAVPAALDTDPAPTFYSNGNGVFEPGEMAALRPAWKNVDHDAHAATGTATLLTGPAPGAYFLTSENADYGTLDPGGSASCAVTGACLAAAITQPGSRPATHWDATLSESLSSGDTKEWSVHLGNSFADVPRTHPFYLKIETLLHNGITGGCSTTDYCPGQIVTRDQMAIFLARVVAEGASNIPAQGKINGAYYQCAPGGTSLFTDVQPTDAFCRHVHYLAFWGVTRGCSDTQFCPSAPVDRGSMAAFLVRSLRTGVPVPVVRNADPVTLRSYNCQTVSPNAFFTDVPATDPFCAPIHYLWARGMIAGCGADTYCPTGLVTRDAMAKFLANTFDLKLYGP